MKDLSVAVSDTVADVSREDDAMKRKQLVVALADLLAAYSPRFSRVAFYKGIDARLYEAGSMNSELGLAMIDEYGL